MLSQSRYTPTQNLSQSWWSICSLIQNIGVPEDLLFAIDYAIRIFSLESQFDKNAIVHFLNRQGNV